jgi:hypothetical protein
MVLEWNGMSVMCTVGRGIVRAGKVRISGDEDGRGREWLHMRDVQGRRDGGSKVGGSG